MKGASELLLELDVFVLETEYWRIAGKGSRSSAPGKTGEQLRLAIARDFVEFVREIVSEEFRLGIFVEVDGVRPDGIVGVVDFPDDREVALAEVEASERQACGEVPPPCRSRRPILDRLLSCTEIVRAPDRLGSALDGLKRECVVRFRTDGSLSGSAEREDCSEEFFFGPAPTRRG